LIERCPSHFETYSDDTGGNLASRTGFNGKTTTFTYDEMRRLRTKVPDASLNQPTIRLQLQL
jgi:YD repeat-containing protein